jgi:putative addiction module killer protein
VWTIVDTIRVERSGTFDRWLRRLRDRRAAARILVRIDRLAAGNPGDVQPVGRGVSEFRVNYGPGYRVYFTQRGAAMVMLLCAGDKSSQDRDIKRAYRLAEEWRGEQGD